MNDNNKVFWIISELFYPEETSTGYILTEIANKMTEKYNVKVICGPENYDKKKMKDSCSSQKLSSDIELYRTSALNLNKDKLISRIIRFFVVSFKIYKLAKEKIQSGDKVMVVTNPPLLIKMIAHLKKNREFDFVLLVHDVFPENVLAAGIKIPRVVYKIIKSVFDKGYAKADKLISLGRDMNDILACKIKSNDSTKIVKIENWGEVETIKPMTNIKKSNKLIIQYAGNIGRGQGLSEFVNLFSNVKNNNIMLSFWGAGAVENNLRSLVVKNSIKNIEFNGPYFRSKQCEVLNDCDLALVKLAKGMLGIGVPSKSYNIMAAGKPILFVGDLKSEIALVIKEHNIGYCFDNDDELGLKNFLSLLSISDKDNLITMGQNARILAETHYSQDIILEKFLKEL